ncbi:2OG-Fe(II) oxygenase superfamily protein [Colwellia chukchiensis]|uniref:2OG-Fe(II) oxygenase superfamily protein n=1 Tax=Colwellia chukchiensis TaxID=641665 RepID=A0A1H7GRB3_9GAMM|nr:2OG-Fe(II) oxygenase family protein [Colwellia chukchiensis]SEK38425.1 2OG-Fe(II) oxygenase superfamily protein [Colwellia chukchiensis]
MTIQANNIGNIDELAAEFERQGVVRVFNFLEQNSLKTLANAIEQPGHYDNAFYLDGQNKQASDAEIKKLPVATQQQLFKNIHSIAAKGAGFLYGRHKIENHSPREFKAVLQLLNSDNVLANIRAITNQTQLRFADGQATRYRRGDFLTRHIDNIPGETRRIAYVLGVTPGWHPDWGGLLQFFEQDGTPTQAWSPSFNSLTLFDVNKVHSVTYVTPFAEKNRYSVTGWFRS